MIAYFAIYFIGIATPFVISKLRKRRKHKKMLAAEPAVATEQFKKSPKPGPVKRKTFDPTGGPG